MATTITPPLWGRPRGLRQAHGTGRGTRSNSPGPAVTAAAPAMTRANLRRPGRSRRVTRTKPEPRTSLRNIPYHRIRARSLWSWRRSTAIWNIRIWVLRCIVAGSPISSGTWCAQFAEHVQHFARRELAGAWIVLPSRDQDGPPFSARLSMKLRMSGWRDSPCRSRP
jgi:hypothetical protein